MFGTLGIESIIFGKIYDLQKYYNLIHINIKFTMIKDISSLEERVIVISQIWFLISIFVIFSMKSTFMSEEGYSHTFHNYRRLNRGNIMNEKKKN